MMCSAQHWATLSFFNAGIDFFLWHELRGRKFSAPDAKPQRKPEHAQHANEGSGCHPKNRLFPAPLNQIKTIQLRSKFKADFISAFFFQKCPFRPFFDQIVKKWSKWPEIAPRWVRSSFFACPAMPAPQAMSDTFMHSTLMHSSFEEIAHFALFLTKLSKNCPKAEERVWWMTDGSGCSVSSVCQ